MVAVAHVGPPSIQYPQSPIAAKGGHTGRRNPVNALRRQYFLSYAVIGSVMPLMSVYLRQEAGFSFLQVGLAMSLMSLPMLFSPALLTLLADRNADPRRILALSFGCSAAVLSAIVFSRHIPLTLALFACHGLAMVAVLPLQDGYCFSLAEKHRRNGLPFPEYPLVRVWGSVGFILPSALLYLPLSRGAPVAAILPCAVTFGLLSLANTFTLAPVDRIAGVNGKMPTGRALRTLFSRRGRWLCLGLFFGFIATTTYYSFVGNYYDEVIGIDKSHIGLIINIGVVLEVCYTLLMPRLQRWIGLKGIMVFGLTAMVLRMVALALFPHPVTAVATQLFHGIEVLAIFICPVMFLDRLAGDGIRNSIQGVYTMLVGGLSRILAGLLAGLVVTFFDLEAGLVFGAVMAGLAWIVIVFLFERIPPEEEGEREKPLRTIYRPRKP